ncbi:helix-turn-helix domain-containing protein [Lactococcus nasutitermitis]|uniref:Helix-turn-helix domain-containing protein n=1 Tax=Lactococcus nasutitermitis TaxID=1652957 RepID=A0ABV9JAX5_9LACT|nr:helix-turn-helix transcriptional regulator [Lactococcus nasutitermitis]
MTFYDRLKTLVVESKKSFNQVERELNYPRNALANYRLGKQPSARRLSELADYFNVSNEYLLEKSDNRDHKQIQTLFNKLSPKRKTEVLDFIQKQLESQTAAETSYTTVTVTSYLYRGDFIWQQERLDKKFDVPSNLIPESFDSVIEPIGASFFDANEEDLMFMKYETSQVNLNAIAGFSIGKNFFVKTTTLDGKLLYVGQENSEFNHYLEESHMTMNDFIHEDIVGIYHPAKRSWEK